MTRLRYKFYFVLFFILLIIFISFSVIITLTANYNRNDVKKAYQDMILNSLNKDIVNYANSVYNIANALDKTDAYLDKGEKEEYMFEVLDGFNSGKMGFEIYVQNVFIYDDESVSVHTIFNSEYSSENNSENRYDATRLANDIFYPSYGLIKKLEMKNSALEVENFYSEKYKNTEKRTFYCVYNDKTDLIVTCCFYNSKVEKLASVYSEKSSAGDKGKVTLFLIVMILIIIIMFVLLCYIESLYYKNLEKQFLTEKLKTDEKYKELKKMAQIDPLTKCFNRKYLNEKMTFAFKNFKAGQLVSSAILFDIDNFKKINDTYGHAAGDEVLKKVSETVRNSIRQDDILARWGGEEFVVFFKYTYIRPAVIIAEKIRAAIEELVVSVPGNDIRVTVSVGVSHFKLVDSSPDECIERADDAMYQSKHTGKNKVTLYDKIE